MRKFSLSEYAPETIEYYVRQIQFFDDLARQDPAQYAVLMQHTCIMELEAGEVLIEKDTMGCIFYSLVHGQLAIFHEKRPGDAAICELFPSQILGALSIINHQPRTATVVVSSIEGATVFCTDFSIFGELDDFSIVSLRTKLEMFRDVVRHIYATLLNYEREAPDESLSSELSTLMVFHGERNTMEELEYFAELAVGLAWLLGRWNAKIVPQVPMFDEAVLESRLSALLNIEARR